MNFLNTSCILSFLFLFCLNSFGQIIQKTGSIYTEMSGIISSMPGSSGDNYSDPNSTQLTTWENTLNELLLNNYQAASDSANTIGYNLIEFTDNTFTPNRIYYALESQGSHYWGSYVYYPDFCRSVVVQSPHPKRDANTGNQGIHVFKETESFFYMLSGTHRCNSSSFTSCTGTTSACSGSSEPYRISDLAHTTTSVFQKTTEVLFNYNSDIHFVQLHGFAKLSTDPYVILSNGTQVTPSPDYLSLFKDKLFEADNTLTFKIAHIDLTWTRLRGFFNTQGRFINSSVNACNNNATNSQGRFFHVEQERTKLRDNSTGWDKVAYAVNNTFACSSAPIDLLNFTCELHDNHVKIKWQTLSEINNEYFTIERSNDGIYWQVLERLEGAGNSTALLEYSITDKNPFQGISYYRLKQTDFDGSFSYSEAISIYIKNNNSIEIFPNPTRNIINIIGDASELENISIFNTLGQDIRSQITFNQKSLSKLVIDLSHLQSGIYYLKTESFVRKVYKK